MATSLVNSILVIWIPLLVCIGLLLFKLIQLNTHIETSFDHIVYDNKASKVITIQHAPVENKTSSSHGSSPFAFIDNFNLNLDKLTHRTANHDHGKAQETTNQVATKKDPIRIAYIFAGSVRSFICPHVHWSLRFNAIDAFGGEAYTFIRVSTEDNRNTKTGKGVVWNPKYTEDNILETLKILNPRKLEYFSLSTQEADMKKYFPGEAHTVFRENDLRRYSMYFHRCMGYRLAMEYEKEHNIRFDWVALIRLDAAWLEPVLPIEYYANDRVWLTETGYVAFNDQFMLIPRQYSDYLYDLNTKVDRAVYCLGGPDVEQHKCNATHLRNQGVTAEKINQTLTYCCADVFKENILGYSETIHYRHMLHGHIPVSLARFPVYITRYFDQCMADCDRLQYQYKRYAFDVLQSKYPYFAPMSALDTRAQAISSTDVDQCFVTTNDYSLYSPIKATKYHAAIQAGEYPAIQYDRNLYDQWDLLPPALRFNQHFFHPWKIHFSMNIEGCVTVLDGVEGVDAASNPAGPGKKKDKEVPPVLGWDDCHYHMRYKGDRRHSPRQTFFLLVQPHSHMLLQSPLLQHSSHAVQHFLIDSSAAWSQHFPNMTRIVYPGHIPKYYNLNGQTLCFTMNWDAGLVDLLPCVKQYHDNPDQWFALVRGMTPGAEQHSTVGLLQSMARPEYCICRGNVHDRGEETVPVAKRNALKIIRCAEAPPGIIYFEFEIILP